MHSLPIGIDSAGRAVCLYLVLPSGRDDFRAFLGRHADLFRALSLWTLRLVFHAPIAHAYAALQAVVHDELESPLHAQTVEELKRYLGQLRATPHVRIRALNECFERASETFERPRFSQLYRLWLKHGDSALDGVSSTVFSDALASGAGRVECLVLPHHYDHLSPLVDNMRSNRGNPIGDAPSPDAVEVVGAIE